MKIELVSAESPEIIMNLFQYYIYDMSEYTKFDPNPDGTFTVDERVVQLSIYWNDPKHYPYLILVDGEMAGFSLLRKFPLDQAYFDIGQFFVLRKYKHLGVGREAFKLSVNKHPGRWITRVLPNNDGAYKFWEKVILEVAAEVPVVRKELYMGKEMIYFYYNV
ncbi:GNAT family N-acetyltransferase [Fusibacter paucivorans]|uniref:GNAT family N-acetyltransferase n=1 Tax=Fusibacter paucivorans TaxID=76009 RepID=A0ABS5PUF4_9FIRM|nr:GNAT family N-acetyltransferase [Fusibacter paucivorans]MBS7528789.1 GNAT family N-acetyltransferase [Fusibacter paucivorans]